MDEDLRHLAFGSSRWRRAPQHLPISRTAFTRISEGRRNQSLRKRATKSLTGESALKDAARIRSDPIPAASNTGVTSSEGLASAINLAKSTRRRSVFGSIAAQRSLPINGAGRCENPSLCATLVALSREVHRTHTASNCGSLSGCKSAASVARDARSIRRKSSDGGEQSVSSRRRQAAAPGQCDFREGRNCRAFAAAVRRSRFARFSLGRCKKHKRRSFRLPRSRPS